jgi:hypothetical protein
MKPLIPISDSKSVPDLELPMLLLRKLKNKSMILNIISGPIKDGNINGNLVTVILVLINYRSKIFD